MATMSEKIKSLLAKAVDPASTPAEADEAMSFAQKLMAKHNLSIADIEALGQDAFTETKINGRKVKSGDTAFHPVDRYLGHYIGRFCGCKAWTQHGANEDMPRDYVYFGVESDVEFATYLRGIWIQHFDLNWSVYKENNPRLKELARARQNFSFAFADQMRKRLDSWAVNPNDDGKHLSSENTLVVQKLDLVMAELAKKGMTFGHGTGPRNLGDHHAARGAGANAAKTAGLGRGVGNRGQKLIGAA